MPNRTAAAIALCSLVLTQFVAQTVQAAPNAHANARAQANAGSNGGGGNGNGGGGGNNDGSPHSVIRQYVLANGLKQGEVASLLKSWNSLNANPKAFLNNLDNPNSLLGKEAAYICASANSQTALTTFDNVMTNLGGDPNNPPTSSDATTAQTFLDDQKLLGALDPTVVEANAGGTFSADQVTAAKFLLTHSTLTTAEAQATVAEFKAWTNYQNAVKTATTDFAAASVSYRGSTAPATLQAKVDAIIAQKNFDTTKLCATSTASSQ